MDFKTFIQKFGFEDADSSAIIKLTAIIETVLFNTLNNVLLVTKALKVKTIKKAHFLGVLYILNNSLNRYTNNNNNNNSKSGGTVLPAEYFGDDSGRYFANVDFHNTAYLDDLSRGALHVQEAGARSKNSSVKEKTFISKADIVEIIAKYKHENSSTLDFKVSKDAYEMIQEIVTSNMTKLLKECKNNSNKNLTGSVINKSIKNSGVLFSHLLVVSAKTTR